MNRKRICFVEINQDSTIGGSYYSLLFLVEGLDKSIWEPIVVFYQRHRLVPRFEEAGAKVIIMDVPRVLNLRRSSFGRRLSARGALGTGVLKVLSVGQKLWNFTISQTRTVHRLADFLKENRVDLVHLNSGIELNHEWMLAARLRHIPCISHERWITAHFRTETRWVVRHCVQAVICISNAVRENMVAKKLTGSRLVRIYNALDPEVIRSRMNEPALDQWGHELDASGRRIIGLIGNIRHWKGQHVLLKALPMVRETFPDVLCLFVGGISEDDHEYFESLQSIVDRFDLADNIRFCGSCRNIGAWAKQMEMVIHTSVLPEPFGRVLLEAMAVERPLISTTIGAPPEIVVDNETGLLVPPDDPPALARAIVRMLEEPETAREMGCRGYRRLVEDFPISRNVELTTELYRDILGMTRTSPEVPDMEKVGT